MLKRLAPVALVLLVLLLSGCGGGDTTPIVLTGDFYPLTVGRTWNYDVEVEAETAWGLFVTTGTFTRTLSAVVPVNVDGTVVDTFEFTQISTLAHIPTGTNLGPGDRPVVMAVDKLFQPDQGLQTVRTYYTQTPGPAGTQKITLVATAENGGPINVLPGPRPFLLNPPQDGFGTTSAHGLLPVPMVPPTSTLTAYTERSKTLGYLLPPDTRGALEISFFNANINLGGITGQIGGRSRTALVRDVGVGEISGLITDWTATLQIAGDWARVSTRLIPHP